MQILYSEVNTFLVKSGISPHNNFIDMSPTGFLTNVWTTCITSNLNTIDQTRPVGDSYNSRKLSAATSLDAFWVPYSNQSGNLPVYSFTDFNTPLYPRDIKCIHRESGHHYTPKQIFSQISGEKQNLVGWRTPLPIASYLNDNMMLSNFDNYWNEEKGVWGEQPLSIKTGSDYYYYNVTGLIEYTGVYVNYGCSLYNQVADVYYINEDSGKALYHLTDCTWVSDNIYYVNTLPRYTGYYNFTLDIVSRIVNGKEYSTFILRQDFFVGNESGLSKVYFTFDPVLPLRLNHAHLIHTIRNTGLNSSLQLTDVSFYISPFAKQIHSGIMKRDGY